MGEQSESVRAAVPTVAGTFTAVGTIRAPAGMKRLRQIQIGIAPDQQLASTSIRLASIIRLQGSGLGEQSPHDFMGPCGGFYDLTDTGMPVGRLEALYDVNIPLQLGGDINITAATIAEVLAAGSVSVALVFDDSDPQETNSMADVLSGAIPTAADAFQQLGTLTVPQGEGDAAPKKLKNVYIGVGLDQGIAAFSLRHAMIVRLSGNGLKDGGLHEFIGPHGDGGIVVIGGGWYPDTRVIRDTNLGVNPAGVIIVEVFFTNELPTAGTSLVGVMYA